MERRDVLQRDEDVPVQLDVRHLVDVAGRGEDAFLVLAAEERDLDLLALVLARVVLHRPERSPRVVRNFVCSSSALPRPPCAPGARSSPETPCARGRSSRAASTSNNSGSEWTWSASRD